MIPHSARGHLDLRAVLDYLEHRTDAATRRAVDEHLGRPCAACRERVRAVGELLETMRQDRVGDVPASLHTRALDVFEAHAEPSVARRLLEAVATLVFDSFATPLAAPARRSVGEARRLRFGLADQMLDMELEREGAATVALRGRLAAEDAALWSLEVRCGSERFVTRPDAGGAFALTGLPAGALELHVEGPSGRFRLPPLES